MADKKRLTLQQIKARAAAQTFERGEDYYRRGKVDDLVKRGDDLEGICFGSEMSPYRMSAQIFGGQITETSCTCPYDWGGDCKHIVALLLTYLHNPEVFAEKPKLHDTLMNRSKDELVDLIEQMLRREPSLQDIVDRPAPETIILGGGTLDTTPYRRELEKAFNHYDGWGDRTAENTVGEIARAAKKFSGKGDWNNAASVYQAIIEEFVTEPEYLQDDEGFLMMAINEVLERLAGCLQQAELVNDDARRLDILDTLLVAYIWDVDFGGIGLGDGVPDYILQSARPVDMPHLRQSVQHAQKRKSERPYGEWGVEIYEHSLAELDVLDNTDPEVTLQRLRDQGMYQLLATKLLELKRIDEGVAVIKEFLTDPFQRVRIFPALVEAGQAATAVYLAEEMATENYNHRVVDWLLSYHQEHGNHEAYFQWQLKRMQAEPRESAYVDLKAAAQTVKQWETVRPQVIRDLERQNRYDVLVLAYLRDQDWDAAWETLPKVSQNSIWGMTSLELQVAQQSRHAHPRKALPVFIDHARKQISQRDRKHYAIAAELLARAREMYQQLDDESGWQTLITDLRQEFNRLPALQDELNKAGL